VTSSSTSGYSAGVGSGTDPGYDPAIQPKRPDVSLGELVSEMTSELSTLFRKEIELAKTEARAEVSQATKAGALFAGAGVAGWLGVLFLSLALAWLLDQGLNTALSFAMVAVVWAIAAFILLRTGRAKLNRVRGLPQTRETIKEDVEWAKAQKS
jgi:Putative Actinobacterial Holin-X, holin superfamily III